MQKIAFIGLLVCSLVSGTTLFSQTLIPPGGLPPGSVQVTPPVTSPMLREWKLRKFEQVNRKSGVDLLPSPDTLRILAPDNMPCRVPVLATMEKMPVMKLQNQHPRDPMPNYRLVRPRVVPFGGLLSPGE